jgi:hypothetical protein
MAACSRRIMNRSLAHKAVTIVTIVDEGNNLMNSHIIGIVGVIVMVEIPLIISSWLLIKSALLKINRMRSINYDKPDRKKDINRLIIILIVLFILFVLIIFPILIAIVPKILSKLPSSLRLVIFFGIFIIYPPIYICFYAFFRGLGNVVGAGGSASKITKQLSEYIYEALEINKK